MEGQKDNATGQGNINKGFPISQKLPDPPTGHTSSEAEWKSAYRNHRKANILNQQFLSVFTPLTPLSLQELSLIKVQDLVDDKVISPNALTEGLRNSTP